MDRMGLRTLSIPLIILSSLFRLSALEHIDSDSNCLENKSFQGIYYRCPKENSQIIIIETIATNQVLLQCINNSTPYFDKEILPKLDLRKSNFFELRDCYFNVSFYEILSKFNMNNAKTLVFSRRWRINDRRIINVTKEIFQYMDNIEFLGIELRDAKPNLSVDFLENTPNLRKLVLQGNGLTQISNYFNHLLKLESLDLTMNEIDFIPDGVFESLENLVELQVWNNNLTSITKNTFKGLKRLEELGLARNHIKNIEEESFADLHKLVKISLQFNKIHEPHSHLFKNNKLLENIKFSDNPNLVLPDYLFANLTSLQTIDLSFNNLLEIPKHTFSNCGKLRYLILKKNRFSIIPEKTFRSLTSLRKLDISHNFLKTLSDRLFSSLENLEELYVSNNQLTALDSNIFHKMKKLEILNVSRNNIGFINLLAFRGLKDSLIHLDLSYNQLNSTYHISDRTPFHECARLEELILKKNKIRYYQTYIGALPRLKKIDISFNHIKELRVNDFIRRYFHTLELDLTQNEIQYVDFRSASSFMSYYNSKNYISHTIIHLKDNPIVCDCSNIDLIRYNSYEITLGSQVDIKQDELTCSDNKDVLVTDIKSNQIDCPDIKGCPSPCTCTFKYYKRAVSVDCSFRNLSSYPEFSINGPKYQETILNLRGNHLKAGPFGNSSYENVTDLDLSQNHISEISWIPPYIKKLNLKENHLRNLDSHFVNLLKNRTSLEQIHLENNLWDCNCDASDLQKFLLQYDHKVNSSDVYCHNSTIQLVELNEICKTPALTVPLTVFLPHILTILLCFTVALALYYRYQKEIKIYLYGKNLCLWFVTEEELDKDKTYDVFISYANQDETFVLEHLLPELEHGQTPFKVCVHMRDWIPGELITTQVINTVKDSRRTLVVLSNNFINSLWGILEFRIAHTEATFEGRARVIVVIYGDLNEDKLDDEIKGYLKTNTYVKWGDKYFWNKLKYALPHSKSNSHVPNRKQVKMMDRIDEQFELLNIPPNVTNTTTPPVTLDVSMLDTNFQNINIPKAEEEDPLLLKKH